MKNVFFRLIAIFFAVWVLCAAAFTGPGIRVKEQKATSTVYEIRLEGTISAGEASKLDSQLRAKTGILSAKTAPETRILTLEADRTLPTLAIEQVIRQGGFLIAKTFD